jgi:hypothetical protein
MEDYLMKVGRVGEETLEVFRTHRTIHKLRQLPLASFYACAAAYSGPIALLYRKYDAKQIKLPDQW